MERRAVCEKIGCTPFHLPYTLNLIIAVFKTRYCEDSAWKVYYKNKLLAEGWQRSAKALQTYSEADSSKKIRGRCFL
jgi:hypothetical protein